MFKESFKYYKSKKPPPDYKDVLNFHDNSTVYSDKITYLEAVTPKCRFFLLLVSEVKLHDTGSSFGVVDVNLWKAYELKEYPGLIYLRNPFTALGQRYWTIRCLKDYTCKPNKLNLDSHDVIPVGKNWWDYTRTHTDLLKKLRWATLGYHHNWDSKVYSETSKSDFPEDLSVFCSFVAKSLGFPNFTAEAAIVNFYHMDSTLSGHTDHSEANLDAPLFSFSFGNSAIFLLGGRNLDDKPVAMFLHSGDIVVMSKASRLSYHGVPRIVQNPEKPWNEPLNYNSGSFENTNVVSVAFDEKLWSPFEEYLHTSRINVNIRQVLNCGQERL